MSSVDKNTLVKDLVENKVYIWTTRSEFFPKVTDSMILWTKDKQIVIDPDKIADKLLSVKEKIDSTKKDGKTIVVILDKEAFKDEVKDICSSTGISFLNNKVPSGIFTNFETFWKRIQSLNKLKKFIESPAFEKITKKEQLMKKRELEKLQTVYEGVSNLNKLPDLVVVIDAEYNSWVIRELEKVNIPYIATANTNLSRYLKTSDLVIMNTNSYESVTYVLNYLLK
jgi:small subunit ribosomal protein S2